MGQVNAGTLNHRVTLHYIGVRVPNGQGGFIDGPATPVPVWASVTQAKGSEAYRLGQQLQTVIYAVRIRYREQVPELLTWNGKALRVVSRLQSFEQRPEFIDLLAVNSGQ